MGTKKISRNKFHKKCIYSVQRNFKTLKDTEVDLNKWSIFFEWKTKN